MKIKEVLEEISLYDLEGSFEEAIRTLRDKHRQVKEIIAANHANPSGRRGMGNIKLSVEPNRFSEGYQLCIIFYRDETIEEQTSREKREELQRKQTEEYERKEFERLSLKFDREENKCQNKS
jgi:hypothetical protein